LNQHPHLAFFITPHGFGHAARACAVMEALHEREPALRFELFTQTPPWFFEQTLPGLFSYYPLTTDIGLVQETALNEDLPETVRQLNAFLPFNNELLTSLAGEILEAGCRAVVCDISPLGIAAARAAGIPSFLIENFTWDWIYEGYFSAEPGLIPASQQMEEIFKSVDFHIQTEPICSYWKSNLITNPASRKPRSTRAETRRRLGIAEEAKVVLITMGGIHGKYHSINNLNQIPGLSFLVPGGAEVQERKDSVVLLPHHSDFFHPDLITASDVIIGKTGYSTVAETYHSGAPFGFVSRPHFRESSVLSEFVRNEMGGIEISPQAFYNGEWVNILPKLLEIPRFQNRKPNGAGQIAEYILAHCLL
jgi:hypothetical protein